MDARAYVLIEAEAGQVAAVVTALHKGPSIRAADAITGPYDIIATIETSDQRTIGRLVIDVIHRIIGIKRTFTCVAIGDGRQNATRGTILTRSTGVGNHQPAVAIGHPGTNRTR